MATPDDSPSFEIWGGRLIVSGHERAPDVALKRALKRLVNVQAEGIEEAFRRECINELRWLKDEAALVELSGAISVLGDLLAGPSDMLSIQRAARHMLSTKDNRAEKIISEHYGFVWVCNPKVASRSVISELLRVVPDAELVKGKSMGELLQARPRIKSFYKFGFTRNPYARAYSAYENKITNLEDKDAKPIFYDRMYGTFPGMSFPEFVAWICGPFGVDSICDRHFLPQFEQFIDESGEFLLDYVGAVEDMEGALERIERDVGLPKLSLPYLNTSSGFRSKEDTYRATRDRYADMYSPSLMGMVATRYARDFELFRYAQDRLV
jgi:hypothetical protein